jgi:hypothetical protein
MTTTENTTPTHITCDGRRSYVRPGLPDCGCGWGDLCGARVVVALLAGQPVELIR